jgi:hypothetical protein
MAKEKLLLDNHRETTHLYFKQRKMTVPMLAGLTIILPLKFGEPYSSDVRWPVISFSGHLFFYPKMDPWTRFVYPSLFVCPINPA